MMQSLDRETITKIVETTVENILAAFNPVAKPEAIAPLNPTLSQQEFADLTDLGVKTMRLLTNNPRKFVGLQGYGLSISEVVPLEIPASDSTRKYLKAKKDKLGHRLSSV